MSYARTKRRATTAGSHERGITVRRPFTKLRIGEPNDRFEQEADRVSKEVVGACGARVNWSLSKVSIGALVQRNCGCGGAGECEECRQKKLQGYAFGATQGIAPPIVHEVLRSSGQPLDNETRDQFEPRFGHDLSKIRLHTDARSAESARAVNALAYTVGDDIVFGRSQYAPGITSGKILLAHELTHAIQQGAYPGRGGLQRQIDDETNAEDEEQDAGEAHDGDTPVITSPPPEMGEEEMATADLGVLAQNFPEEMQAGGKKTQGKGKEEKKTTPAQKITSIDVDLSSQQMTVHYTDGSTEGRPISSGKGRPGTDGDPCKTQTEENCTPEGDFKIVSKGNKNTTNRHGDKMAWYVELGGDKVIDGRGIGIHNSQPVGGGPRSHGCVRVGDSKADEAFAKKINQGVDDKTDVHIKGKAPTKPWGTKPAPKKSKPKGK